MIDQIDINVMKKKIEDLLKGHNVSIDKRADMRGRGDVYKIKTKEATITVTLGESWVGYELDVNKEVAGRRLGTSVDTDNYPLENGKESITMDIFDEALLCLRSLLEGKVYAGKLRGKPTIAIPQDNGTYKIVSQGRFVAQKEVVSDDELKSMDGLRAVR